MKFGLTEEQYHYIKKEVVDPLTKKNVVVYCYGSRARGDYKKFSDLDLMIEGQPKEDLRLGDIKEKLQNSNFPYKVDLVLFSEFAETYKAGYQNDKILF